MPEGAFLGCLAASEGRWDVSTEKWDTDTETWHVVVESKPMFARLGIAAAK
jgi:hypothetical protein